jgi:4-amino-4-deoxy-L-arabinose transferase-like glycosyltransferase
MTPRSTVRRDIFVLCLLALVLFLPGLGSRDLWNPNEPTYGLAVAEMTDAGEWWIPTVNGVRFLEKPILYFWLARVATLVGGVNEFALRLPSLLAALVSVAFVYLLGLRHAGRLRGVIAAL